MIGDYWLLLGDHDWARVSAAAEGDGLSLAEYASRATGRRVGRVWRESELHEPRYMRAIEYRPDPAWSTYRLGALAALCVDRITGG